jgi:hypothetical protein
MGMYDVYLPTTTSSLKNLHAATPTPLSLALVRIILQHNDVMRLTLLCQLCNIIFSYISTMTLTNN